MSDANLRPTDAQKRAISKAVQNGFVMRAGAFSDGPLEYGILERPDFDRGLVIDRCIAAGWMAAGMGYNQYVPTEDGLAAIQPRRKAKVAA